MLVAPGLLVAIALAGSLLALQPKPSQEASDSADEAARYKEAVTALATDTRDLRIGGVIRPNLDAKTRLIIPNKCEAEGEAEIHAYALGGGVEESFIFIPALCLWIEIGYNEKKHSIRLDQDFISAVQTQHRSFSIYHVHPRGSANLEENLPSYTDLLTLVLINAMQILDHDFLVNHRVVSQLGVTNYRFADKKRAAYLIEYYGKSGLKGYEAQNLAYEYAMHQYRKAYRSEVMRCKKYSGTIQQQLVACSPLRTKAFIVSFRPHTTDRR